jgi:hypothetical protein
VHDGDILNYLDSATNNEESSQDEKIDFHKVVIRYLDYASEFARKTVIPSAYEFRKNHSFLMISLLTNVNNCLIGTDKHVSLSQLELIDTILTLIWILTDKVALIPMFVNCGYVEKTVQWIRTDIFASHIEKLGNPIFSIVYNLSRDKMGLKQLRTEEAFDKLMERKQLVNDRNNDELTQAFGTTLIALATNDETPEENKILILHTSRRLYEYCKKVGESDDLRGPEFHLSELMELLHRAFSNTYVIKDFLENKTNENPTPIQYFPKLLLSIYGVLLDREADDLEKRAAEYLLKILLQISSYPEYQKELTENNQLCVVIESLANRPKQDDAKRIWCNLQQQISPEEPRKENSPMIYVSYDWADQEFCKEFVKDLRDKITIEIWVDYEHEDIEFSDDMWEYLSSKIKSATVIIVLVSTAYGESTDKFQELSYIISNNKLRNGTNDLIVVKTEPNFNFNRSWMRDLLSDKFVLPYENNIGNITYKVRDQIVVSKKSFFKCFSCPVKDLRRKTTSSDGFLPNFRSRFIKSSSATDSSSIPVNRYTQNESTKAVAVSDTILDYSSGVLNTTTKQGSYSIVSSLTTQTGSADCSTWV